MPTPKTKYLEVHWIDAWSNNSRNYTPEEFAKERGLPTVSVGQFVASTKHGVTIALSNNPSETSGYRHVLFVPRGMITRTRNLK